MDKLIEILSNLRPDVDFATDDNLVTEGIIDSLDLLIIIGEISERFNVKIGFADIIPENFNSAAAMYSLIQRLK